VIVAITGSSGFIGSALVASLRADGHRVIALSRRELRPGEDGLRWDPSSGAILPSDPSLADVVVHLAGENVFGVRWTAAKKQRIRESRVASTRRLTGTLTRLAKPPAVFVCASGVNAYGSRGDEILTEDSARGSGFLAEVCREWEAASAAAILASSLCSASAICWPMAAASATEPPSWAVSAKAFSDVSS